MALSATAKTPIGAISDKRRDLELGIEQAANILRYTSFTEWQRRQNFANCYSWSIPTQEAIVKVAAFLGDHKTASIGAGHGLWEAWLAEVGVTIEATDVTVEHRYVHVGDLDPFAKVRVFGSQDDCLTYLQSVRSKALFVSWPPYKSSMAHDYVVALKPKRIVYVGEGQWGCTADSDFFDVLSKEYEEAGEVEIPQWNGIHDMVHLYTRSKS